MPTLLLNRDTVKRLLNIEDVIKVVEEAFIDWTNGKASMPPKAYLLLDKGDFRAMPAAVPGAAGVKWVNVHPGNKSQGLPTVMAVLIYSDPETGYPLAIMDATEITAYRTGATAAIASKHLARQDSRTLGIIGAGTQAYTQIIAHAKVFDLKAIKIYDMSEDAVEKLVSQLPELPLKKSSLAEASAADIVCTVTPSRVPFINKKDIRPGTHINAVGADAPGKQELDVAILKEAVVIVDDIGQASAAGEINVPISNGEFKVSDIYATLGEIIAGKKPGRKNSDAITIFDSTGVAIEDIATAKLVYRKAIAGQKGTYFDIF